MSAPVTGVLLAGGQSRRMGGGDKCLLPVAGRPMLAHAIDRLAPQVSSLVLNANGPAERFADFDLPIAPDSVAGFVGPLAGILTGCRWAAAHHPDHRFIVTAAADTPFFPTDLVARLVDAAMEEETIVLAASGGRTHPVFGLWPVGLADDLENWLAVPENRKILTWVNRHPNKLVEFDTRVGEPAGDPFFNINTPEDLRHVESLGTEHSP
ncbi:MAG: molybdenum cofactor guanylyltransferase MobA [Pseudomonadota bacterium]